MNIYVYSDESGVFDKMHNSVYVFGGVIFLSKEQKDDCLHKYKHAEDVVRINGSYAKGIEIKANTVKSKQKYSLFRSLNQYHKFAAVVYEKKVEDRIFDKKIQAALFGLRLQDCIKKRFSEAYRKQYYFAGAS